ncbi:cytochrome c-type biogenesis CcmH-like mitochondrial protein [Miscanthus floridulus]|uniref:cytochrome c-type biogenesis CcmH-like mitochondrial protein n=2 Tax=Miscanthus floridulus TaxID=154761 RepID=UPI0034589B18
MSSPQSSNPRRTRSRRRQTKPRPQRVKGSSGSSDGWSPGRPAEGDTSYCARACLRSGASGEGSERSTGARSSTLNFTMAAEDDVKQRQIIENRARNISHNVRCTECGSQSIEDSQADVAILLRKLIRDEIKAGKNDKEIYKKLEDEYGETVLYAPKFDLQTAGIWLSPVIVGGIAAGIWAYQKHRQRTNVHIMALNLVRGVPLTPREKETMLDILTPPPPPRKWWWPGK